MSKHLTHFCYPIRLVLHQHLNSHVVSSGIPPQNSDHTRGQYQHLPSCPPLVSNEQNGFIKGRYKKNNTRLMFDFIDCANRHDKQSTLLSLDMCKTFDSLKWGFIFKIFECYEFGDNFIRFLKNIYHTQKCCIINNNHMSSFFKVLTGVRQGDPLSPTIFV